HPRHEVDKVYRATVRGDPGPAALEQVRRGIELADGLTSPAGVQREGRGVVTITIHEGRNRQVRRMLAAVGHPVRELHRLRYAFLSADDLPPGSWREVTAEELRRLRDA